MLIVQSATRFIIAFKGVISGSVSLSRVTVELAAAPLPRPMVALTAKPTQNFTHVCDLNSWNDIGQPRYQKHWETSTASCVGVCVYKYVCEGRG